MAKRKKRFPWRTILILASFAGFLYKWNLDCSVCASGWAGDLPRLARSLERGGNPDSSWQGVSAMDGAFWHHHQETALYLLRHGANPNTLIPNIVERIGPPVLNELVAHGLKVRGVWGERALFFAVREGRGDIVETLLRQGASPNARDVQTGETIWQVAHEPEYLTHPDSPKILRLLSAFYRAAGDA